jgi:S1-C subfamily serine protease
MQLRKLTITLLLPLLLISFLACADKLTTPDTLTEEEIAALIAARVAEELAKISAAEVDTLTPQEVAEIALRSTVVLKIKKGDGKAREGSGFVVSEGQIVTAHHVVKNMQRGSTVRLVSDATAHLIESVIATDRGHDLSIIKVPDFVAPPLSLGDSDVIWVGQHIFVVGHPEGYIGTFSDGLISTIRPEDEPSVIIQITAPYHWGAVRIEKGEVIAIATSGDPGGQNLNFAAPVNALKALLKTIQ